MQCFSIRMDQHFYPTLTGSKTPPQSLERNEKDRWGSTAVCARLVRGAGCWSLSVATGRGAFHFRSSISVGYEENPTDGSFTLSNSREYLRL